MKFEDSAANILSQFLEFDQFISTNKLGNGHIHQTYLVKVQTAQDSQQYVLQQINNQIFTNPFTLMQNLDKVVNHLTQKKDYSLAILSPIKTYKGKLCFHTAGDKYWRLFPYFENTITYSGAISPRQAFHTANAFGQFANALSDFPSENLISTISDFHNSLKRYDSYKQVLTEADQTRLDEAHAILTFLEKNAKIFDVIQALSLPKRVVHNDTKIDNVLMNKETGKGYCVIDLDTVMPDTILVDFGDMVRTFTNSEVEDSTDYQSVESRIEIFEAMCKGYLSEVKNMLIAVEKENLLEGAKWIILEQCLRFLTDYLANDIYYPIKYPNHNLVRATNQMHLFQSINQQEKQMNAIITKSLI
ncbi:MAG: aminoglycoside phosphotransferase family protein [Bacteroidota bacterium]